MSLCKIFIHFSNEKGSTRLPLILDLGLVYEIKVDENKKAYIKMTLTAPNCPMVDELLQDVHDAVSDVPNISDVAIELVFDPPWDKSRMSEEALLELGFL